MTTTPWRGILTATALPFDTSGAVDFGRYAEHVTWLIRNGSDGVVCNGSLGEYQTLTHEERAQVEAALASSPELLAETDSLRETALQLAYSTDPIEPPASGSEAFSALRAMASRVPPSPRFIRRTPLVWRPALRTSLAVVRMTPPLAVMAYSSSSISTMAQ